LCFFSSPDADLPCRYIVYFSFPFPHLVGWFMP
jgi:hypothetical protein